MTSSLLSKNIHHEAQSSVSETGGSKRGPSPEKMCMDFKTAITCGSHLNL
jgi:hypothetical protein